MRITSLLILTLLVSVRAEAWECRNTNNSYEVGLHWELASDVVAGKIVSGTYLESNGPSKQIRVELQIQKSFKGSLSGTIEITSDLSPELAIGKDYVIFLYGAKYMDFCTKYIALLAPAYDNEFLKHTSKRPDLGYAKDLQFLLKKSGIMP